ncbi:Fic/DOC family protein [Sinorhizobium medicae]|nr:Fic/DOC family protein [Sinorhizobium medicae]
MRDDTDGKNRLGRFVETTVSLRLIREMHQRLLDSGRGGTRSPGEFRTSQNWIGGTRPGNAMFVPPPPNEVMTCLGDWERFIHEDTPSIPSLVKAGLIHVQFETIHPFLNGNGRLGRLLITLFDNLCSISAFISYRDGPITTGFCRSPRIWNVGSLARVFPGRRGRNSGSSFLRRPTVLHDCLTTTGNGL